ncbi:MAG: Mu transposase C-terminal domain-containing protein [Rhizobiaceae bacterium]|nr:Mu transposase C-terminal domain-containing protein [Rhizobiaceae bacterium]
MEWFNLDQIIAANRGELPISIGGLNKSIARAGWRLLKGMARKSPKRGGGWLYHVSLLPETIQARLSLNVVVETTPEVTAERQALWHRYDALSKAQKNVCETRLKVVLSVEQYLASGMGRTAAARVVAAENNISMASLFNWRAKLAGFDQSDWLAALASEPKKTADRIECHEQAYIALKSDFLRPEKPTFTSCYRRMEKAAGKNNWAPIPGERSMRRHLDQDVPKDVQKMARDGRERTKILYPAQRRTREHFHAMQAVNMDGHKFDVFVKWPDGRIVRAMLVGIQDLYSGKIIAWRLCDSENKEMVRLVIGDMVDMHGIPEVIYLDNGRAFASKWITGGAKNRFRFKIREEEPQGLVVSLGMKIVWTTPYSGQSKPIERAWRDLADTISRHPACAGAWTGNNIDAKPENYGNAAIPLEDFRNLVEQEIIEHNARSGRKATAVRGRSFDQAFEESLALETTIVKWPTEAQRSLWLLAAEQIRAQRGSGEIHFFDNRYWSPALTAFAGKKVTVRFDPDALHDGVAVYDIDDRFICQAKCLEDAGFDDVTAARSHNRDRRAYFKAVKDQEHLHRKMSVEELARLYTDKPTKKSTAPKPPTKVTRLANAAAVAVKQPEEIWDDEAEASFSRGLRLVTKDEI